MNPKFESRNPKQIRNSKLECPKRGITGVLNFAHSDFEIRISCFFTWLE